MTESLGSRAAPSLSPPTAGEPPCCRCTVTVQGLRATPRPVHPPTAQSARSEALAAPAAEPPRSTMGSSQTLNNVRTGETAGQGEEGRAGRTARGCCAAPANQTQTPPEPPVNAAEEFTFELGFTAGRRQLRMQSSFLRGAAPARATSAVPLESSRL